MSNWRESLPFDPIPPLLASENPSIQLFTKRDLLDEDVETIQQLWELPNAARILNKQRKDGSWQYPGKNADLRTAENYNLIETYRNLGFLIEKFGFDNRHPAIQKATNYIRKSQTMEGDLRGIYGTQYSPNYTAAMLELLIKAGYEGDPAVEGGLEWLLSMRQDDGGWAIPIRTLGIRFADAVDHPEPHQPDRSKSFSHMVTGIVLRAFATHSKYQTFSEIRAAGDLLASRFFKNDKYPDRRDKAYWERVSFPFWWTDIVTSLDTLSLLGFSVKDHPIQEALGWLRGRQQDNSLFDVKLLMTKDKDTKWWVCLAICRSLKRFQ